MQLIGSAKGSNIRITVIGTYPKKCLLPHLVAANKTTPNEFRTLILKTRAPRRGALCLGPWGEPGAFHLFGIGSVTPKTK